MEKNKTNSVAAMKEEICKLYGEIYAIENRIESDNLVLFVKEVGCLLSGVGEGYVEGDYYAPTRYYSEIPGVKNIRKIHQFAGLGKGDDEYDYISVKVESPRGYLLPDTVTVFGETYPVEFSQSSGYSERVDY